MNFENYGIGFIDNTTDITGVLMFLAVKYGHRRENPVPYYKRKDLKIMESNTFMMPIEGKSILRNTGEEVEIIDYELEERGARSDEDWVTYIDSNGKEHIRERLNFQLDFKTVANDMFSKVMDFANTNKLPITRNNRIFEVAKELCQEW